MIPDILMSTAINAGYFEFREERDEYIMVVKVFGVRLTIARLAKTDLAKIAAEG